MRGYFEIGIYHVKTEANLGTLWRSAYQLGAAGIFVIGRRFQKQASDTTKAWRHIPLREYNDFNHFLNCRPYSCVLVGVEMGGRSLKNYHHPDRAIYLLGAEDHGIPASICLQCQDIIGLESIRTESYNVAVAGAIVMHHRLLNK